MIASSWFITGFVIMVAIQPFILGALLPVRKTWFCNDIYKTPH